MARMHSRKKGVSGSRKPLVYKTPSWVRYQSKEIEMLIVKLAKEEHSASMIGLILRDSYGVPDVKKIIGKTITQVLKEKKLVGDVPEDLFNLLKRAAMIRKHLVKNKKDTTALRGLQLTESKILRLSKYYKENELLAESWQYRPEELKMLAE